MSILPLDAESERVLSGLLVDQREEIAEAAERTRHGQREREEVHAVVVVAGGLVVEARVHPAPRRRRRERKVLTAERD